MKSHRPASHRGRACSPPLLLSCILLVLGLFGACTSTHTAVVTEVEPAFDTAHDATSDPANELAGSDGSALVSGVHTVSGFHSWAGLDSSGPASVWTSTPALANASDWDTTASALQRDDSLEVHGSLWFYFGRRFLSDKKFWSPIEEPSVGGFEVMYYFVKEFPFEIEFGFLYSTDEDEDMTSGVREEYESFETYIGLRKSWDINFFATHLYFGGGVSYSWVEGKLENGSGSTESAKDQTFGAYAHTGFFVPLGTYLVAGIDLRGMMAGNMDLNGNSVSADYIQAMALAGFYW